MEGVVETPDALGFYHRAYLLSSFAPNPFTLNRVYYVNLEHFLGLQKAILAKDVKSHQAIQRNPHLARPLARDIKISPALWRREYWSFLITGITAMVGLIHIFETKFP